MRPHVVVAQIVRIVGDDQRNAGLARHAPDLRHDTVCPDRGRDPASPERNCLSEEIRVFVREPLGIVVAIGQHRFVNIAAQAGRKRNQPFGMLRQQILVDARLVVKPVQVAGRDQVDQVLVAFLVFAEENQVVIAVRTPNESCGLAAKRRPRSRLQDECRVPIASL